MKNSVFFAPSKKDPQAIVTPYERNPEYGYVQLQSTTTGIENGWIRERKKSCLIRGKVDELLKFVNAYKNGLPGKIAVREFMEDELPEEISKKFLNQDLVETDMEEAIAGFVKSTGEDGIDLTVGGKRILRFSEYDPQDVIVENTIQHDNVEEVKAAAAERRAAQKASFGG